MGRRLDAEWVVVAAGLVLVGVGWAVHLPLLALAGTLLAATSALLWVWQRECLSGVSYRRTLSQQRATFGEELTLEIELVNDKLLPLTWLYVEDYVSSGLTIRGASMRLGQNGWRYEMNHLLPMLPYQRVRRRMTVVCDRRGAHRFGPAQLRSGDPIGLRERMVNVKHETDLLIYPKLFRIAGPAVVSRLPLGDQRARADIAPDPSRAAGVREYRPGDSLRHVDWRATARSTSLLVREFEPSASWRVAVFSDIRVSGRSPAQLDASEFVIAVTASIVADLARKGIATGLYSSASVHGRPVARAPSTAPDTLPAILECLALASPYGGTSIAELLVGEASRMRGGTSIVIIASDFSRWTIAALTGIRRRLPVTAVWVKTGQGSPPSPEGVDLVREVSYHDDWTTTDVLEFAS